MIKIIHLTSVHSPLDTRIFMKECNTLKSNGYDVTIVAPYGRDDVIDGIKIRAVTYPKNRFMRIVYTTYKIYKIAILENATLYHFHDPELMIIGLLLKCRGKKVIYDVHEDLPRQMLSKAWIRPYLLRKLTAFIMMFLEKIVALIFDAIVTVTPYIFERFPPSKTIILRNYVFLRYIDKIEVKSIKKNKPVIIYHGTISRSRGIKEIIQSIGNLVGRAELWIFGDWKDKALWHECTDLEGWKYTQYFGHKDVTEIYGYLKLADIGLQVLHNTPNYKGGSAVKVFEYMACSIPFIATDNHNNRERYNSCALYVNPMDVNDITEKMVKLLNDDKLRKEMGRRGRYLSETNYSWEKESEKLVELYKRVLS